MSDLVEEFAGAAARYCAWCEAAPRSAEEDRREAVRQLVELYRLGAALPLDDDAPDIDGDETSYEQWQAVYRRFANLPFGYYHVALAPFELGSDAECGLGDVADDLADIYRDVRDGLSLWRAGHRESAQWAWAETFRIHWSQHAVDALRVLHAWAREGGGEEVGG
ncbi:MAG: DUF5063 domain-containing protein [Planctomycetes bacterium]|nr:DUF5063 domain-containing protein [Planctomycetota bacterium]